MLRKFTLLALLCSLLAGCSHPAPTADLINPVVGDVSFVERFGKAPTAATDEDLRIRTHLAYAEQTLRRHTPANLPPALQARRQHVLGLLHDYWQAGIFPRNFDHPEQRLPCFIDRNGRLCAVGYLVAETAGRAVAEKINEEHQYDHLRDMRTPELLAWVETSGLTREECALIQPRYGAPPTPTYNKLDTGYGVATGVWGGLNVALSAVNASQISNPTAARGAAWAGLMSGGGQVLLGSLKMPKEESSFLYGTTTNQTEKTVSVVNIGLGTATMVLSAWNLLSHRQQPAPRTSLHLYSPTRDGLALSMTRRF